MALAVTAQLPKERTPGKDEKPEDKTRLDKEFKDQQKKLEDKLSQEKSFEKWVYLASNWTFDSLLKDRAQLLVEKKEESKKDEKAAALTPQKRKSLLPRLPRPTRMRSKDIRQGTPSCAKVKCPTCGHFAVASVG